MGAVGGGGSWHAEDLGERAGTVRKGGQRPTEPGRAQESGGSSPLSGEGPPCCLAAVAGHAFLPSPTAGSVRGACLCPSEIRLCLLAEPLTPWFCRSGALTLLSLRPFPLRCSFHKQRKDTQDADSHHFRYKASASRWCRGRWAGLKGPAGAGQRGWRGERKRSLLVLSAVPTGRTKRSLFSRPVTIQRRWF